MDQANARINVQWNRTWAWAWTDALTVLNPPEEERTYSSSQDDTFHRQSMLDSPTAWSTWPQRDLQWLQMDLGRPYTVRGVLVQGRGDQPWRRQYVTKFGVQVSMDSIAWTPWAAAGGVTDALGNHEFDGPSLAVHGTRREEPTCCMFQGAGWIAKHVRIVVTDWSKSRSGKTKVQNPISMRAAVLVECAASQPPLEWLEGNLLAGRNCTMQF